MARWRQRQPRLDYGPEDTMLELSALILEWASQQSELKQKQKYYELDILSRRSAETRRRSNKSKESYTNMQIQHESLFGKGPEHQITTGGKDLSGSLSDQYTQEISNYEGEIEAYDSKVRELALEISAADRVQKNIGAIGYEYGDDPLRYEAGDVTPEVLSSQFGIDEELMGKILTANPLLTSPQFLRSMELIRQQSLAKEEEIKTTQETSKTIESALTLGNSRFMRQMDMANIKSTAGESDKTVKEFATTMYNEKDQPYHVGDLLLPGATLEQKYAEVINLQSTIGSFLGATPDKVGLTRYVTKWKQEWESEQDPISKAAMQTNLKELFNIDISQSEQFIYQEYIMGATEDPFESTIRNSYVEAIKVDSSLELQSYIDDNMEIIMKMYKNMFGDQGTLEDFKKKLSAVSNK